MFSGYFFSKNKLKQGIPCLYVVGKIFQYRISFNIIYNESCHKTMKNVKYVTIFSQNSGKNVKLFKTDRGA